MVTTVSIIGTGNVATHIATSLYKMGVTVDFVVGRTLQKAHELADRIGATASDDFSGCFFSSHFVIVAVNDDSYAEVISKLNIKESSVILHTSGSLPMSIFKPNFSNFGVFYPLQTFSMDREISFDHIPLCIEASSDKVYEQIKRLAGFLSEDVRNINSEERGQIHLAAVFCNNFSNYMFACAQELLADSKISFDILFPLILESAKKTIDLGPQKAQTGPAKRGDFSIINKHLAMIEDPKLRELYSILSTQIYNNYKL